MENEMKNYKLSVIVPVYNVESYINRGINSLLGQSYTNLEIILVDDGSTDNSGVICDEYAKNDERIIVVHKTNEGIVSARQTGISMASGEYSVNFDPDDWIESDAYEEAMKIVCEYEPDVYAFGMVKEYGEIVEKHPVRITEGYHTREGFWKEFCGIVSSDYFFSQPMIMAQWDKIVKTNLFKKFELICPRFLKKNVDDAVVFPLLLEMKDIYIDSRCWYHYCVRNGSILWETKNGDLERVFSLALHFLNTYNLSQYKDESKTQFLLYKLVHHMMLDVPELFINDDCCSIYPKVKKNSKVIVYGKGVFANRLILRFKEKNFVEVVDNIDSSDAKTKLKNCLYEFDYVIIAIFNSEIVSEAIKILSDLGLKEKITIVDKSIITKDILPETIRRRFDKVTKHGYLESE